MRNRFVRNALRLSPLVSAPKYRVTREAARIVLSAPINAVLFLLALSNLFSPLIGILLCGQGGCLFW